MSYLTQMLGLTVQNFVSAASGMAVLVALIRGLVRHSAATIGNFWIDLTRLTLYVLLPLSLLLAIILVGQGVVQTFGAYHSVPLVDPVTYEEVKKDAEGRQIKDEKGNPVTEKKFFTPFPRQATTTAAHLPASRPIRLSITRCWEWSC